MIIYNSILSKLSASGYSSYRLTKEKILSCASIDRIRKGQSITIDTIDVICGLLKCQPGDILQWIPNKEGRD